MKKVKKLLINILVLTATSLLMRTIGVFFSAYLFNRVGAAVIGVYQLIISVYAFAITIATSGIKFTVTRLISEEAGKKSGVGMKKVMRKCFYYALGFSIAAMLALLLGAPYIGTHWLDDPGTVLSLRILALGLPFIAASHVITGYFTAIRKVATGSMIMIIDQFIMIGVTLVGLALLLEKGLAYICLAMVFGAVISEVVTCGLLLLNYLKEKRQLTYGPQTHKVWSRLLKISLPIALGAYARSGLYTLQNILIPKGLRKYGASSNAAFTAYGTVHGMVLPMVLYPSALLLALSELLIPEFTECQVNNNRVQIHYMINRVLKLSFLFTVCVMGVLFYFSNQLGTLFHDNQQVSFYLKMFAPLVLIMYMDTVVDGMLKGLGEQFQSMKYNVIDAFCSVLMVYFLIPLYGIKGYIIMVMVSEVLNFTLSIGRLIRVTQVQIHLVDVIFKPLVCILITVGICYLLVHPTQLTSKFLPASLILQIIMMIAIYIACLFVSSCLKKEDFHWFLSMVK